MKLKVTPFPITILVDTVNVNPSGVFVNQYGLQNLVNIQISASSRIDAEGNEVVMSKPYLLENPTSVPHVPFLLVAGLLQAQGNPDILAAINAQIEAAGYNQMFTGSLDGFKLEITEVVL